MFVMPFCAGNQEGSCPGENGGTQVYTDLSPREKAHFLTPHQLNPQLGPLADFECLCPKKHRGLPPHTCLATWQRGSAWMEATRKTLSDPYMSCYTWREYCAGQTKKATLSLSKILQLQSKQCIG